MSETLISLLTERKIKIEQELNFIDQLLDVYDANPDGPQEDMVFEYTPPKKTDKGARQEGLLAALQDSTVALTGKEIAERAGVTPKQAYNALYNLRKKGLVTKQGTKWRLK